MIAGFKLRTQQDCREPKLIAVVGTVTFIFPCSAPNKPHAFRKPHKVQLDQLGHETEEAKVRLPNHWGAAIEAFEKSDLMKRYLGERFVKNYTVVKGVEIARFMAEVTELDFTWHLRNA